MSRTATNDDLRRYLSDPAAFQAELIIPSVSGPKRFSDAMAPFQRERFASINPALLAVANGKKPEIGKHWWEATKGASKDSDLAVALLWLLAFSRRPLTIQVGAADADQADELRKAAKDILHLNKWLGHRVAIRRSQLVCDKNDSAAEIIAADVAGSHGARPDVLILNELSHVTKQEFAENLVDNAAKVPQGLVVIATNAGFLGTWQHRWRELARLSTRWAFQQWAQPSPWLNPADIEEAKRRNSNSRYLRLWWGVWAAGLGDAIDGDDLAAAVAADRSPMLGNEPGWLFVGGLDLGVKRDHAALVVLGANGLLGRVRLASCQSWAPRPGIGTVDLGLVEQAALTAYRRFNLRSLRYDPSQMASIAQRLQKEGCNVVEVPFVGQHLDKMATAMLEAFRGRKIDLFNEPALLNDIASLRLAEKGFGFKLEAKRTESGHADRAIAMAIALPEALELASSNTGGTIELGTGGFMLGGIPSPGEVWAAQVAAAQRSRFF